MIPNDDEKPAEETGEGQDEGQGEAKQDRVQQEAADSADQVDGPESEPDPAADTVETVDDATSMLRKLANGEVSREAARDWLAENE